MLGNLEDRGSNGVKGFRELPWLHRVGVSQPEYRVSEGVGVDRSCANVARTMIERS